MLPAVIIHFKYTSRGSKRADGEEWSINKAAFHTVYTFSIYFPSWTEQPKLLRSGGCSGFECLIVGAGPLHDRLQQQSVYLLLTLEET